MLVTPYVPKLDTELVRALREAGAVFLRTGKHHVYRLPNGRNVIISRSPSDRHATSMAIRDIRRLSQMPPLRDHNPHIR